MTSVKKSNALIEANAPSSNVPQAREYPTQRDEPSSKRLLLPSIADYDLNRLICELVDNALDVWTRVHGKQDITIGIVLDKRRQRITVEDNAGGIPPVELKYIIGQGESGTSATDDTIGIFGADTKRAVTALAQQIKIKSRHKNEPGYQADIDEHWLDQDGWELPVHEIEDIKEGATIIELQKLRIDITEDLINHLQHHLAATYAKFLASNRVAIQVNGEALAPHLFENWAYPPGYEPSRYTGLLKIDGRDIKVEAIAGLTRKSSPATGEYGVYFYCNDRLVARAMKTFDVGFTKGFAGLPHPKISLIRVLVSLNGDARLMPWNSSKSDISINHEVFIALHDWLVEMVKYYASLSRRWVGEWPEKVFKYETGNFREKEVSDFRMFKKSFLPPLPEPRRRYKQISAHDSGTVAKDKPWTKSLYEGVIAADLISRQRMEQKNRIALIVLFSSLEIAFKEYLVNEPGKVYTDSKLSTIFARRSGVHKEIKSCVPLTNDTWKKIEHYYKLRCRLVHERAPVGISDAQIQDFREVVEGVLQKLYKLKM
ncbi:MAG: ATP-binding protein [Gallionella sp.]